MVVALVWKRPLMLPFSNGCALMTYQAKFNGSSSSTQLCFLDIYFPFLISTFEKTFQMVFVAFISDYKSINNEWAECYTANTYRWSAETQICKIQFPSFLSCFYTLPMQYLLFCWNDRKRFVKTTFDSRYIFIQV